MGMTEEKCYLYGSCKCQTAGCVARPDKGCPVYRYFKDLIIKDHENCSTKPDKIFEEIIVTYPPEDLCPWPEFRGKPYFEIRFLKNGEDCIGYGAYDPKVLSSYLSKHFINNYKAGSEDVEVHPINENIAKGFEEFTKMMFRQGQAKSEE